MLDYIDKLINMWLTQLSLVLNEERIEVEKRDREDNSRFSSKQYDDTKKDWLDH